MNNHHHQVKGFKFGGFGVGNVVQVIGVVRMVLTVRGRAIRVNLVP